ncbi:MAG: DUF3122 domain-containing protein [Cyanobacteria bacterium P01_H01_bin.121]
MGRYFQNDRWLTLLVGWLIVLLLGTSLPQPVYASLHTYHEHPGQVTYRSRQSLRDDHDRAWQAIAFKRLQGETLQGIYLRLVGFPGNALVDRQKPILLMTAIGQQWQIAWAIDPQTQALPDNVGQYNLQPVLRALNTALPLIMQIPLQDSTMAEVGVAPFVVKEWLQVKNTEVSASPIGSTLREESHH